MFFPRNGLASNSTASAIPEGSASRGVMSRKRMPFFGKSGISRISGLSESIIPASVTGGSGFGHHRIPQLPQRLVLDLPHPLARQPDPLPDLFERHRILAVH